MIKAIFLITLGFTTMGHKPVYSLLVPGMYQIQKGLKRGYIYLLAEGTFLTYYFYTKREMTEVMASYIEYAREHACGTVVKSNDILSLFEKYMSFNEYYEMLYREARQIYPDDPAMQDKYVKENLKTDVKWQWDSQDAWYTFQDRRRYFRELSNSTVIMIGFVLTNHLVSLVDGIITDRLLKNRVNIRTFLLPGESSVALNMNFK